jgi:hypothetical protein
VLFEDFTLGSLTSSALMGLGLVMAAPLLLPMVGAVEIRPKMVRSPNMRYLWQHRARNACLVQG